MECDAGCSQKFNLEWSLDRVLYEGLINDTYKIYKPGSMGKSVAKGVSLLVKTHVKSIRLHPFDGASLLEAGIAFISCTMIGPVHCSHARTQLDRS